MTSPSLARIVVAVDGSVGAARALDFAVDLALRYGSELTVVGIAPLVPLYASAGEPYVPTTVPDAELAGFRGVVDAAVRTAESRGVTKVTGLSEVGVVVDEILAFLEGHPADLLVVGSRGLSTARRILLGSVSTALVTHAPCPVLVVRGAATKPSPAP